MAYAKAAVTNLFRVVYHSLSDVFGAIHDAAARLVQFLRGRYSVRDDEGRTILLLRGIGRAFLLVDPDASTEHVEYFVGGVRRRDESLGIALKLLGLVVNVLGSWALGAFNVAAVLRTLTTHAPELLRLGRNLLLLWRPSPA